MSKPTEQERDAFQDAYRDKCLSRLVPRFDPAVFTLDARGEYLAPGVQSAWWGWIASKAQPAGVTVPDECPHMIVFDDYDRPNELFAGVGARPAALRRFEQISGSWNAHLFVRMESNSRDYRCPSAVLAAAKPVSGEQNPVAVLRYQRYSPGLENEMPAIISCSDMPDGDHAVYAAPPASQDMTELMREHRIAVTPEYEGQWHADLYGHEAEPLARAEGDTPEAAVHAVIAAHRAQLGEQPEHSVAANKMVEAPR